MTKQQLTKNQTFVFEALKQADGPLSAYTILDKLRDHGFRAPLQVYRALEKLVEFGLIHRLESLNAFVACAHDHATGSSHGVTVFAICDDCGLVNEIHDKAMEEQLAAIAHRRHFKTEKTTIEMRGHCQNCLTA